MIFFDIPNDHIWRFYRTRLTFSIKKAYKKFLKYFKNDEILLFDVLQV
jgi:hypothetical protein